MFSTPGIASKIINSPTYNLFLGLPFLCVFYVINVPLLMNLPAGFQVKGEFAALLYVIIVAFCYVVLMFFITFGNIYSELVEESKWWVVLAGVIFLLSLLGVIRHEDQPKITLYFTFLSGLILISYILKKHDSNLSKGITTFLGVIACLICFVAGISWLFDHHLFIGAIKGTLGLANIKAESYKVGGIMLVSMGYSIGYGVSKLNEIYEPKPIR